MCNDTTDITAEADPRPATGSSIPHLIRRALTLVAHAGVSIGLGLLVGGLAGAVIGTGVGLIWFWGPPLAFAIASSGWMRDLADWDRPSIDPIRQPRREPEPSGEDTAAGNGSAS